MCFCIMVFGGSNGFFNDFCIYCELLCIQHTHTHTSRYIHKKASLLHTEHTAIHLYILVHYYPLHNHSIIHFPHGKNTDVHSKNQTTKRYLMPSTDFFFIICFKIVHKNNDVFTSFLWVPYEA